MGNRIAGVSYVKADGDQFALKGDFTVSPSAVEREGIAGLDGVHGYKETPRVPFVEGNFSLPPELSIEALEAMTNVTITTELANGRVYVLRNAWTTAAFEIDAAEGQVQVRWEGESCDEI